MKSHAKADYDVGLSYEEIVKRLCRGQLVVFPGPDPSAEPMLIDALLEAGRKRKIDMLSVNSRVRPVDRQLITQLAAQMWRTGAGAVVIAPALMHPMILEVFGL